MEAKEVSASLGELRNGGGSGDGKERSDSNPFQTAKRIC